MTIERWELVRTYHWWHNPLVILAAAVVGGVAGHFLGNLP